MNKIFLNTFLVVGISLLFLTSCKKNNLVIDQGIVPPTFAKFNTILAADTIGTYYIKSTNDPFKLPVGITNVSGIDRTIQFSYSSNTAVIGEQYNTPPASLVIPAGKAMDSLTISGLFAGYPLSTRIDTLKIQISGSEVPASPYKSTYRLIMRKYCDVILADFAGNYQAIDNGNYGPYPMAIAPGSFVSTGPTSGSMVIKNLWDYGVPTNVTVNLDWTSPANFTITIPDQVFVGGDDIWIKGTTAGTFSSCDQTFTFRYTLYVKTTGVNYYANQVTKMNR